MRHIVLFFVVAAFCACAKTPEPVVIEETETQTLAAMESSAPDMQQGEQGSICQQFVAQLEDCSIGSCVEQADLFGFIVENVFTINGYIDGKCSYSTSLRAKDEDGQDKETETMLCAFSPKQQMQAVSYLKDYFSLQGDISVEDGFSLDGKTDYKETIESSPVYNPFSDFLNDGTCKVPPTEGDAP